MKSTAQIPITAFVYRGPTDREETAQKLAEKAEGLKLVGKYDAADGAAKAAERLRRERKPMELMPMTLVQALGGVRDPIAVLVKDKALSVGHARVALALRDHEQGATVTIQGGIDLDRVDGKSCSGPEAAVDARRIGRYAWERAEEACQDRFWQHVRAVIIGQHGIAKACRRYGWDGAKGRDLVKANLVNSIDAAAAYLGIAA